jgi:hypothetical protein
MVDRTKLYAVTRDRNGRRKWAVVGTLTPIKTGATEIYFEHTPTGAVGLESVYLPAGAEFPELPSSDRQQPAAPTGESESE